MNKQQLANKIWESANKMRSKIEANEYKDYILGFIFYKFLSDKEVKYLKENDWTDEYLPYLKEDDEETRISIQKNIGYFISYENLFSTWISKGSDFNASDVTDALNAFSRLINPTHKKVFDGIFDTLQTGLSKLGETSGARTKAISDLIYLIKDIPMDGKQDYDVLGFIYEYLISNFAANAGKKAGEFYTPHEVSLLMSEIVAEHLNDREEINIYDPTSGSGSLLINIGKCVAKHMGTEDKIKYYAQELKENTYNLTRMNLVMRGIIPDNIAARNGDTLKEDWPYFDENDPIGTYNPLYVDAVVSNPPYSQNWDPPEDSDPRYKDYGLAPKSKADYAFLLHDLFHVKPDGIMTIVLPHGVLFRGGEEGEIRKHLIENNKIDAIIGLPANIFFGTGIPTIIMVLKHRKENNNTDILIVDASKGFEKVGKNNKLRACDIKKIVDVVKERKTVDKFSKLVSRTEVRENDYNLNIPRYVDSSEKAESWDIYASMFGGIPASEIDEFAAYWNAFPHLKDAILQKVNASYYSLKTDDIKAVINACEDVQAFKTAFNSAFGDFDAYLENRLISRMTELAITKEESVLSDNIFERLADIPLIDEYEAYQLLSNEWNKISVDLEMIQTEGTDALTQVDPNMVIKKKNGKDTEVQEGYIGHIIPFEIVQKIILKDEKTTNDELENRLSDISSELQAIIDELDEDNKQKLLNDDNDAFVAKAVAAAVKEVYADIINDEILSLKQYLTLSKKAEKQQYIENNTDVNWSVIEPAKDGTYGKTAVNKRIQEICKAFEFENGTYENTIVTVSSLLEEEKQIKKQYKAECELLHIKTKETIESLSLDDINLLLKTKWITPLIEQLYKLPEAIIDNLIAAIKAKMNKYSSTFSDIEKEIEETENALSAMIDDLVGDEFEMQGLQAFKALLGGN